MRLGRLPRTPHVIVFLIVVCSVVFPAQAQYSGGSGTADDPYQIATAADLILLGETPDDYDQHFKLMADIDLSGYSYDRAMIAPDIIVDTDEGFQGSPFTGVFDGNGRTISHLTIAGASYLGLFGRLGFDAEVNDLGVVDADIIGSGHDTGGLVGWSDATVANCYSTGTVASYGQVGGLVGTNAGSIIASYCTGAVTGNDYVGGVVGSSVFGGRITTSYCTGTVSGTRSVGGLVGSNDGSIIASYSAGTIISSDHPYVGHLVGENRGRITMSYSTSAVNTPGGREVGLVGSDCCGSVTASFWEKETSLPLPPSDASGKGLTATQMQDINTYLRAGWDFVDETFNGTCDYWQISPGDYPRLRYHASGSPPMPEGLGTAAEPYLIRDAHDLGTVWLEPSAHYRLDASVDLSGITWSIAVVPWFGGTFDGNGHLISNLHIHGTRFLGLFGEARPEAEISNLGLEAVDVNGIGDYVGALVGSNDGSITMSYSAGRVSGDHYIGGLVGCNGREAVIIMSHSTGTVMGDYHDYDWSLAGPGFTYDLVGGLVGGLVGNNDGSIIASYSTSTVSGDNRVGGLVGCNGADAVITMSHSTGTVMGDYYDTSVLGGFMGDLVGGLVGSNDGSITRSHSTSTVSGYTFVGGLVGDTHGRIAMSYSTGTVNGHTSAGGLAGRNWGDGSLTTSYSSGTIDGGTYIGGLVGDNSGRVSDSYSTSTVSGDYDVGGLVGDNTRGRIAMSYSTGTVSGYTSVGGLVGSTNSPGRSSTSFWDIQTSGQTTSAGGTGVTTAEMQMASTFFDAGWDFVDETENGPNDVWKIIEGQTYPLLSWQKYGGGTGEPNDPYLIYTAEHLNELGAEPNDYDKHFKLMADIDLSGHVFTRAVIAPDMNDGNWEFDGVPFTGVFDGNGNTISHLTIEGGGFLGLFGKVMGQLRFVSEIRDLGVLDVNITGSGHCVGGLVGTNEGLITNSCSTGSVSGDECIGGLVGINYRIWFGRGTIANCYADVNVVGNRAVGGLAGENSVVGGQQFGTIMNCYATGSVLGVSEVGGLVGYWRTLDVRGSFWDVETSGLAVSADGIGLTTAEMQTAATFLDAGWDFIGETENGTEDIWWIDEGKDYPRLWWERDDDASL